MELLKDICDVCLQQLTKNTIDRYIYDTRETKCNYMCKHIYEIRKIKNKK